MVLDPVTFFAEIDELQARGYEVEDRILVSSRTHLVLSYHKLLDRVEEQGRGSAALGTTGRGIGGAYEDKVARAGLRVADLIEPERLRERLQVSVERAECKLRALGSDERIDVDALFDELSLYAPRLQAMTCDVGTVLHAALRRGERVLLEGAQGSMLDVDHGTYPFVTSSNTTSGMAATGVGLGPTAIDAVLGVVKAYTTRVGNGPLPTELPEEEAARLRELGAEYGATTGRPRRTGWFDAPVVRYAARLNGLTGLAVSKLDVLDQLEEVKLAVKYRLNGEPMEEIPADLTQLSEVQPEYETMPGWQSSCAEARRLEDLPPGARAYLNRIEELTGLPIRYVSVGTRREQIIEVPG
jgi:adenylosuccinate synthase